MFFLECFLPSPLQAWQLFFGTLPLPRQTLQVDTRVMLPKNDAVVSRTSPLPAQTVQSTELLPFSAPLPPHSEQGTSFDSSTCLATPLATSRILKVKLTLMSSPLILSCDLPA